MLFGVIFDGITEKEQNPLAKAVVCKILVCICFDLEIKEF